MQPDVFIKAERFVSRRHNSTRALLVEQRNAKLNALRKELTDRGFGFSPEPGDPRFDQIWLDFLSAAILSRLNAWFEAYDVYGLQLDDQVWLRISSYRQQIVDGTKNQLRQTGVSRSVRTGRNSAHAIARADSLGMKVERTTHQYMKSMWCEIEKRKHALKTPPASPAAAVPQPARKISKRGKLQRRETVIFAAILLELKGPKYCSYLQKNHVSPKWSDVCPGGYSNGYNAGPGWRKKIQDEKSRVGKTMDRYTDTELADAVNTHLQDQFAKISQIIPTRATRAVRAKDRSSKNPR